MIKLLLIPVLATVLLYAQTHNHELCEGIVEDNNMSIPVGAMNLEGEETGITEEQFNDVMDRAEAVYGPIISDLGGTFKVNRLWTNNTVNASAQRSGSTYIINMYGGLARHFTTTYDSFMMVVCHEIGHHLGGAPQYSSHWASNEGQSDYFAGLKCMRKILTDDDNITIASDLDVDPIARQTCIDNFSNDQDRALCMRTAVGGYHLALIFKDLRKEKRDPKIGEPDMNKVSKTSHRHPQTQCRLDTYYQGGVCSVDHGTDVSSEDYKPGTCTRVEEFKDGLRPLCWFKPTAE